MYIKHVLSDNTLLNSPPGSFLLETKLSARYTKRLFWGVFGIGGLVGIF